MIEDEVQIVRPPKSVHYAIVGSDRMAMVDSAINLVSVMSRRISPDGEFNTNHVDMVEEEHFAYREACKFLGREFRDGATETKRIPFREIEAGAKCDCEDECDDCGLSVEK